MRLLRVHRIGRFTGAVIILVLPIVIFFSYVILSSDSLKTVQLESTPSDRPSYILNTSNCRISDLGALNEDILPFVEKYEYLPCSTRPLMTYIEKSDGVAKLKINQSVIILYSWFSVRCCYSYILREERDSSVRHSTCEKFQSEVILFYPFVKVVCRNFFGVVYRNVHSTVIPKDLEYNLSSEQHNSTNKWKIFMLGIDSISRLNLQRTMPEVYFHLEKNAIGFKGYNKIDDNTFPNLVAILTGRSMGTLETICSRNSTYDDCDFIWKSFKESGYITAYGEDEPFINTFNYYKHGFLEPPTDMYLRPYFLSAYLLPRVYQHSMTVCTGPENTADRMFNAAKDLFSTFRNHPIFTLYWLNSFSHDDLNLPSSMNHKIFDFLTDAVISDFIDDSIFIFFSDHGFRFGDFRFTYSGWLEERLPFLYFKFPKSFQQIYPRFVNNFQINAQNRLTTPYDFFMTLQHILKLSNNSYNIRPSLGCPKCKSLFELVEENRTCEDASIPQHWCTCEGYTQVNTKSAEITQVGEYVVERINQIVSGFSEGYKCAKYRVGSIETAGKSNSATESNTYLILVKTYPYAMFEATVRRDGDTFEILGQISRTNRYASYTSCIRNDALEKYCFCNGWPTKILSTICRLLKC